MLLQVMVASAGVEPEALQGGGMRTLLLVDHRVADFDVWKRSYDGAREWQRTEGVRFHQVLRAPDDPNRVLVTHVFDTRDAAEAFVQSPRLGDVMAEAGVDPSSVKLEYLDEVDEGNL
jgi:heme-degrading monooxygenase HmoA